MQPLTLLAACFCQLTSLWVGSVFWLFLVWSTHKLEKLFHFRDLETEAQGPRRHFSGDAGLGQKPSGHWVLLDPLCLPHLNTQGSL